MGDSVIFNENLIMKTSLYILVFLCFACQHSSQEKNRAKVTIETARSFTKVDIEVLLEKDISVRAIEVTDAAVLFAGDKGNYGFMPLNTGNWTLGYDTKMVIERDSVLGTEKEVKKPTPFRSIASTKDYSFMLSIGSPGKLYRSNKKTKATEVVFEDSHPKAFYDSMDFWNDQEGIAMGDPTEDCLSVIVTRDGGASWQKISCEILPKVVDGEAAFAASDTNIKIMGDETWIVSGGKKSRVFYSPNKGREWTVVDTPIVQGKSTQGAYTMDFYDRSQGIIYGGDYTDPSMNINNVATTSDGGKTWNILGSGTNGGYKSCVQYVPNRGGKELIAIGFTGISYSKDAGAHWTELSKEPFLSFRFSSENVAYASGRNRIAKLTFY